MARPREFDEEAVLDAAVECFWARGYEATSMRDLIARTGIACASLYNAFGDKHGLYEKALDRYVEGTIAPRIRRSEALPPRAAIRVFFSDVVECSLSDSKQRGCMLVNAALDAPDDPDIRNSVAAALLRIEGFFCGRIAAGQANGAIARRLPPETVARLLLGELIGVRVLARVRPERDLLEDVVAQALGLLDHPDRQ
jgi:TetR/AcrR family transcriptional repressor of nem operon